MFETATIKPTERGLLYRRGSYAGVLLPGTKRLNRLRRETAVACRVDEPFLPPDGPLAVYLQDARLAEQLEVVEVGDGEYAAHRIDGRFERLLLPGLHAFWKAGGQHGFQRIDTREPDVSAALEPELADRIGPYASTLEVESGERGFLFYDHELQRELGPGRYRFWRGPVKASIQKVDLRRQQLELHGQEMMTADKVTLRLNFVSTYRVSDPRRTLEIRSLSEHLHASLQLILRDIVAARTLDRLLAARDEAASEALERLRAVGAASGVEFLGTGIKDVILPGEMRDILNTVLLAEKKAQANLITRREETASTRSLLNTAKLMEDNETLYRLKEMEMLERLVERMDRITLDAGSPVLEQLARLAGGAGRR
ncbi:slipin family protein [Paenibacillus albicereus]|uniref:Slipin family protein n=1 Tax=Paenibacillus albicereus TaxID=2726185 RepID=A0A6H2GUE4_9BACL|nr:slipin family protein [Paenibacillus albicereus]QJC51053.1 slipin family protein [Paenibacillus albicereus]